MEFSSRRIAMVNDIFFVLFFSFLYHISFSLSVRTHSCGINGPNDWKRIYINTTVPSTCCHLLPENVKQCTSVYASKEGCYPKLLNFLDTKSLLLGFVGIGIAIVQLIGVIFACALSRAFRENYETV